MQYNNFPLPSEMVFFFLVPISLLPAWFSSSFASPLCSSSIPFAFFFYPFSCFHLRFLVSFALRAFGCIVLFPLNISLVSATIAAFASHSRILSSFTFPIFCIFEVLVSMSFVMFFSLSRKLSVPSDSLLILFRSQFCNE